MNGFRTRVVGVALALAVVTSLLTVASVAPASAADNSFVIEQGGECVPMTPLSGSQDVEEFYDYRNTENTDDSSGYTYSSFMPKNLQAAETSRLFLYDGPSGVSLVLIHNERDAGRGDSAASFDFSGLPSSGEWTVVDDTYSGQDDQFSRNHIDWTWLGDRTDGGVFRGIDRADLDLTITPAWNEDAALYDSPQQRSGEISSWQVLSGDADDPQVTTLPSMTDPVTIRTGTCGDDGGSDSGDESAPNADLSVSPAEPSVGDSVTFDAQDANDESGIVEYRWDFDGDGSTDDTTSSYRIAHAYESAGTYDASVTVADAAGNTATANATVTVGDDAPLEASAEVPENATVGDEVTVDGSASTGDIVEYSWDFGDGAMTNGPTPDPHPYSQAGIYNVTLTVTDADGDTDSVTSQITINEPEDTATPENETTTPDDGDGTTTPDDGDQTTAPDDGNETTTENDTTTPDDPATETPESTPEETTDESDDDGEQSNAGGTSYNSGVSYSAGTDDDDEPTPTPEPPEMSVSLNRSAVDAVDASVRHAKAGETAAVELANASDANATYRSLDVAFASDGDYDLTLRTADSPGGAPALSVDSEGATPFAYLNVSHPDVADANVSNATVTFAVSEERLAAANASAEDVALYRHHDGEWTELDIRQVEASNGTHVFAAESPGLSTFAVGAKRPAIAVEDVTLSDSAVESGGTVTVTATVANAGGAAGSYTVDLTAFGEVVDSEELTLDAGESKSVTFVRRMGSPGAYELSVGGENATLQVTGSTATETADDTTTNGSGQPGFGVTAALVAVLAALAVARRRRN